MEIIKDRLANIKSIINVSKIYYENIKVIIMRNNPTHDANFLTAITVLENEPEFNGFSNNNLSALFSDYKRLLLVRDSINKIYEIVSITSYIDDLVVMISASIGKTMETRRTLLRDLIKKFRKREPQCENIFFENLKHENYKEVILMYNENKDCLNLFLHLVRPYNNVTDVIEELYKLKRRILDDYKISTDKCKFHPIEECLQLRNFNYHLGVPFETIIKDLNPELFETISNESGGKKSIKSIFEDICKIMKYDWIIFYKILDKPKEYSLVKIMTQQFPTESEGLNTKVLEKFSVVVERPNGSISPMVERSDSSNSTDCSKIILIDTLDGNHFRLLYKGPKNILKDPL
jgi:hypothetical protein